MSADEGRLTVIVSLNLTAALDVTDHSILLNRLQYSFGISGTDLACLHTFTKGAKTHFGFKLHLPSVRQ